VGKPMTGTERTPHPSPLTPNARGSVLAFDFGEKRIGVAVADVAVGIAHPLAAIHAEDNKTRFAAIAALIAEWQPKQLIVGEPHHADGGAHEIARLARRFAQRLDGRFNLPVTLVDESFSSATAESRLHEQGVHGSKLKAALDSAAACEIMQTWLEQQRKAPGEQKQIVQ
jgi:putative holliday junction resolvase